MSSRVHVITGCILTDYDLVRKVELELHDSNDLESPLRTTKPLHKIKDMIMDKFTTEDFHPIRCELIYGE